jgi:PiT family inorganic phosphate transporter
MAVGTTLLIIILAAAAVAFYTAWNIGANDVANAMGTSVASGALSLKRAVIVAAILNFLGAVFVGTHVSNAHRVDIVYPEAFSSEPMLLLYGMFAALIAAAIFITIATYFGLPISTTHAIVGAIAGYGIAAYGFSTINVAGLTKIMSSWAISPLAGAAIAYLIFIMIKRYIFDTKDPIRNTRLLAPPLMGFVFFIMTLSMIYKGLKNLHLDLPTPIALSLAGVIGVIAGIISYYLINQFLLRNQNDLEPIARVEKIFLFAQVVSAMFVAFAHGANDVGNAVGPMATIISVAETDSVATDIGIPLWLLVLGGFGILIGTATWGVKVMDTIGKKITEITATRGFSAEFGAATTVLICSKFGLPISTTHVLVGAVIGVGLAGGLQGVDVKVIGRIILSWIVTLPIAAFLCAVIFIAMTGVG